MAYTKEERFTEIKAIEERTHHICDPSSLVMITRENGTGNTDWFNIALYYFEGGRIQRHDLTASLAIASRFRLRAGETQLGLEGSGFPKEQQIAMALARYLDLPESKKTKITGSNPVFNWEQI